MPPTVAPAMFSLGCAQVDITPPLGVSLAGYFHDRVAARVRDPLYVRALVLATPDGDHADSIALVSMDLCAVTRLFVDEAKRRIHEELGIPPERVMVSATHTHTGPEHRESRWVPAATEWRDGLPERIAECVKRAAAGGFEGTLRPGSADVTGYAFNRITRLADGAEVFGPQSTDSYPLGPAGPVDPEMVTLAAVDMDGRLRALVVNFGLHVDVIGGGAADFVSADWPGEMAKAVSAVYGEDVVTIFLQGTAGDVNQNPYDPTFLPTGGPAKAVQLGRALAGAAMMASERAEPMANATLDAELLSLAIPYYTRDQAILDQAAAYRAKSQPTYFEHAFAEEVENWRYDGETAEVGVQCLRVGDVGMATFPGEVFTGLGLELKRWSPAGLTMPVTLANDAVTSYFPTTDQAERGGYGAMPILSRFLVADAGRRMVDAAGAALQRMWRTR